MGTVLRIFIVLIVVGGFSSCGSQKISKIDYDRLNYEHNQLQLRYDLLKKQSDKNTLVNEEGYAIKGGVSVKSYEELQLKYKKLEQEYEALNQSKHENASNDAAYLALNQKYDALQKDYEALEQSYSTLQEKTTSTDGAATTNNIALQKELNHLKAQYNTLTLQYETVQKELALANSKREELAMKGKEETPANLMIADVRFDDFIFTYDEVERTDSLLNIIVFIKNKGTERRMEWLAEDIQLITEDGTTYPVYGYRIGRHYAAGKNGKLTKYAQEGYTLRSVFAFEKVPANVKVAETLKMKVTVENKEKDIEFKRLDLGN